MLTRIVLLIALVLPMAAAAQSLVVSRGVGDSVRIDTGYGSFMNKDSSLNREWVIINDPAMPLQIETATVAPTYIQDRVRSRYVYSGRLTMKTGAQAIVAYEVRMLVLDVFGERQKLLSLSSVGDVAAETSETAGGSWDLYSSADASTAFYSIAYVAAVRTESGQIYRAQLPAVLAEIQKISANIKASDIEREKPGPTP